MFPIETIGIFTRTIKPNHLYDEQHIGAHTHAHTEQFRRRLLFYFRFFHWHEIFSAIEKMKSIRKLFVVKISMRIIQLSIFLSRNSVHTRTYLLLLLLLLGTVCFSMTSGKNAIYKICDCSMWKRTNNNNHNRYNIHNDRVAPRLIRSHQCRTKTFLRANQSHSYDDKWNSRTQWKSSKRWRKNPQNMNSIRKYKYGTACDHNIFVLKVSGFDGACNVGTIICKWRLDRDIDSATTRNCTQLCCS